jgi:hypothetical protein
MASKSQLPKLRKTGLNSAKKPVDGQTSFRLQDCMNFANFDLMQRLRGCKDQKQVNALLIAFRESGYNKVAFSR